MFTCKYTRLGCVQKKTFRFFWQNPVYPAMSIITHLDIEIKISKTVGDCKIIMSA